MGFFQKLLAVLGGTATNAPARVERAVEREAPVASSLAQAVAARSKALQELRTRRDPASLGLLIDALEDPEPEVRREAARAIYGFGRDGQPALAAILRASNDPDPQVRVYCMSALAPGCLGPPGEDAMPVLMARLRDDPAEEVRREALAILSSHLSAQKPALRDLAAPLLIDALRDPALEVRRHAAFCLGWNAPSLVQTDLAPQAARALTNALGETDPQLLYRAAVALVHYDVTSTAGIPALIGAIRDPIVSHHLVDAARTLARIQDPAAREALRELDRSSDPTTRLRGACALLAFVDEQAAALRMLGEAVGSGPEEVRKEVLELVRNSQIEASKLAPLRPALLRDLSARLPELVRIALWLLSSLEPDDQPTVAAVTALARTPGHPRRGDAIEALGRVCQQDVELLPVLHEALQSPDESTRRAAASVIGWRRERAASTLPALLSWLQKEPGAASYLLHPIGAMGKAARPAIPQVVGLLAAPEGYTRDRAAEALSSIGLAEALDVPAQVERIRHAVLYGNSGTRRALVVGARSLGQAAAPLVPALGELLGEAPSDLRPDVVATLIALAPVHPEALGWLLPVLSTLDDARALEVLRALADATSVPPTSGEILMAQVRARPPGFTRRALTVLARLGEHAVLPLLEATQSSDEPLSVDATRLLLGLAPAHLDALGAALHHADASLRLRALGALDQLGTVAHPILRRALAHEDERVREQAAMLLG